MTRGGEEGRADVLLRVRAAIEGRAKAAHPGPAPDRPPLAGRTAILDRFEGTFRAAGGEVVRLDDLDAAREWSSALARQFATAVQSPLLPDTLRFDVPAAPAELADLGVSLALGAAADTGSVVLTSREGRRLQLLAPVLVVWVRAGSVAGTLGDALAFARDEGASAYALHSGPSKSADIGRVLVTGVHGPGRIIAALLGF